MRQQIIIINGGSTYPSYEEFLIALKNLDLKLENIKPRIDWKQTLQKNLGNDFEVYLSKMPNVTNARYDEWKIYFEKVLNLINDDVILVGHSLGGIFLAKYLDENKPTGKIKALILVSAPYDEEGLREPLAEFSITSDLKNLKENIEEIYLIHSKDDLTVPLDQFEKYKNALPNAKTLLLDGVGHFKTEYFPELAEVIKKIR
jgi:predicted alpha/beta hydrolase family esterase